MRLRSVEKQYGVLDRLKLTMLRVAAGPAPMDAAKSFLYRGDFYGTRFSGIMHTLLRGPSTWTVGERELFAAFISQLNECQYCVGLHGSVASSAVGDDALRATLTDWRSAPLSPKVRAMLGFLEKMTLAPESLRHEEVDALRAAQIDEASIETAIYICWCFSLANRVGDALGLVRPSSGDLRRSLWFVRSRGYQVS